MLGYNPVTGELGNCIVVGRGAIAIRLALEELNKKGKKVLVPSNICYAAVLPILYAGYSPVFCDVDCRSGNVTLDIVRHCSLYNVVAALIPHMYGNPVLGMEEIVSFLHDHNVAVIEDCASLMSKEGTNFVPGMLGDFSIYSTGYSKTIDIGFGGLLYSKFFDLSRAERIEQSFHPWNEAYKLEWNEFSQFYRILRNDGQITNLATSLYSLLPEALRESFNFSISDKEKRRIIEAIRDLDMIVHERRRKYQLYKKLLIDLGNEVYVFESFSVPWRFNLLIDNRERFIKYCLENKLPVSDWYPRVTTMFSKSEKFPGAEWHENHIVNFPLLIQDSEIEHICRIIKDFQVLTA